MYPTRSTSHPRPKQESYTVESDGPDNVYFNAVFPGPVNSNDFRASDFQEAEFSITRTLSIIPKCSDYYCSVVRFAIPLSFVPIQIMNILPGCDTYGPPFPATPRNITPYIIGIRYNGVTYTQNIAANDFTGVGGPNLSANMIFQPTNFVVPPVFQRSLVSQNVDQGYQGVFTFEEIIDMINNALAAAFAVFILANPLAPQAATPAPFFIYDPITELISLIAPITWATTYAQAFPDPTPTTARVCMNNSLETLLTGFRHIDTVDNTPNPANQNQFLVENQGDNGYPVNTYPAIPVTLRMSQDYSTIPDWVSLRSIVITTNTLPLVAEAIPTGDTNTGNASSRPIITDFVPAITRAADPRSVAYYNPTAQYRLADMQQDNPLQKIDLKVYWVDQRNNLYPLYISKYDQATIKIGFFKKSLYREHAFEK